MSQTLGYYFIEKNLRMYQCWPTKQGLRGFGGIVLIIVNTIWVIYPSILEIMDYKREFAMCLFHMQFVIMGLLLVSVNVQALRNRRRLFETINLLSDFNEFGIPKRIESVEKTLKAILKIIHYGGFLLTHLMTYFIMLNDNCVLFKDTKHCSVLGYYVFSFDLKPWEMTLILLFQIYTFTMVVNIIHLGILLYCYSLELLVMRIENLKEMIDNISLTQNRKRNFNVLRPIVLYHQDIFKMFQFTNDFFTNLIVPIKIFTVISLTISTTAFALNKDFICFSMIVMTFIGLFLCHTMGQRLTTASVTVAEAVYNLNWYDADGSTQKDVLILLTMSQRALTVEVLLFGQMSHMAAGNEYKKVYAFYNWLAQVSQ